MTEFSVAQRARRLAERLKKVPSVLCKTELDALLGVLGSDAVTKTLLDGLLQRERPNIGEHAGSFAEGKPYDHALGLEFANTPERRAAFGYNVLLSMLRSGKVSTTDVRGAVLAVGEKYKPPGIQNALWKEEQKVECWVNIFISPIIDYLETSQNADDFVLAMMVKYKQRAEWFDRSYLLEVALQKDDDYSKTEERLKQDFYRYLFDQGMDFFVEPFSPSDKSRADVLSAKLEDGRRLVVEAKVHDGKGRKEDWVTSGITQAASYAQQWGEPHAYLLVYNICENSLLKFSGARQEYNLWAISALGKEIRIVDININNKLPASQAKQLQEINIAS